MFKTHRTYSLSTGVKGNTLAVINHSPNDISVIYHSTMVVRKHGQTITLMHNGWDTVSTRIVINRALEQLCNSQAFHFRYDSENIQAGGTMTRKQYWVRLVYADQPCTETNYMGNPTDCRYRIRAEFKSDSKVRFAYIMTFDSYGECFLDLIRRGDA